MSDHMEEQEMEAEALAAIFDTAFEIISNEQPFKWAVSLYPVDTQDDDERDELNHVGCILHVQLPMEYPDALPIMDIKLIKGLANEHREQLIQIANDEAQGYEGMPAIYAVCEAIRAWLSDNNIKGLDDVSMHAQMMRKQMEAEKVKAQRQEFESQKVFEEMTEAEKEELEVRKRRAEGTPCTEETFNEWKKRFEEEMAQKEEEEENGSSSDRTSNNKKKSKSTTLTLEEQMSSRITGYEYFTQKGGVMNLELLEKAAEEAAEVSGDEDDEDVDVDELDVDEDLFDDDDDDLDDLDFDDDEEEEEYDEEEIDI